MDRIFVSSTFKDMHAERDLVQKIVEPELRKAARLHFSNLDMIDLRWGVDTSDKSVADANIHILNTCIREVKNCNPYMLIFLGERYGTLIRSEVINSEVGCEYQDLFADDEYSLTAVEIEVGLLRENYGNIRDCVICMRNPVSTQMTSEADRNLYCEQLDKNKRYLQKLKERIFDLDCDCRNIITYDAVWDEQDHILTNLNVNGEPLQDVIIKRFISILKKAGKSRKNCQFMKRLSLMDEEFMMISGNDFGEDRN